MEIIAERVKTDVIAGSIVQPIDYVYVNSQKIIGVENMETISRVCEIIGNPKFNREDSAEQKPMPNVTSGIKISSIGNNNSGPSVPNSNKQGYRPTVQPAYQPPPNYRNQGTLMKNEAPARIIPIADLNPSQGPWAIKARVTSKGALLRDDNSVWDFKMFYFDLLDSDGGEIRVTCCDAAVDRFYDTIEAGKVYVMSKGRLVPAFKSCNHLKNEWEIFLEDTSTVERCPDEDASILGQQFSFRPISEIESVVITVNPSVPIFGKNGKETQRRVPKLIDQSGRSVELTMWGEFCNKEGQELQEIVDSGLFLVVAIKAGKVSDVSGKSIGTISTSRLLINPDSPEAIKLRQLFNRAGKDLASQSVVCLKRSNN